MLRIVTDGGADFPEGWEALYEVNTIPLRIQIGDRTYLQGQDIGPWNFYQIVQERREIPRTSLPSPWQILEFYQNIAQKGDNILSIHLGSKLSGTYAAVQLAAQEMVNEINVFPFDSGAGSAILSFLSESDCTGRVIPIPRMPVSARPYNPLKAYGANQADSVPIEE